MKLAILLVDDEPSIRLGVGDALRAAGHDVVSAAAGDTALEQLAARRFDLVVTDIRLPKVNGIAIMHDVLRNREETDVILITAYGDVSDAVSALKAGAHDYLTKPFDNDELLVRVARLAERRALYRELKATREKLAENRAEALLVGRSPQMARLQQRIETIAGSDASVIIFGESGTGKELVARTLHNLSPRRDGPFVAVNCASFPETLLEAELFGHERGAFTGAARARRGRFKAADRGTLFLDEIAEIPVTAQVKLLRVIQESAVEPLGTETAVPVDVRVLSATHRDLRHAIVEGTFREDLFYRLHVLDVVVPPLRERTGDLPLLVSHFLRRLTPAGREPPTITARAWAALSGHGFPGNVRELEHAVEHAWILGGAAGVIDLDHLPAAIAGTARASAGLAHDSFEPVMPLSAAMREFEREYLLRALGRCRGRKGKAAEMLGISRKNLWEKLRAYQIVPSEVDEGRDEDAPE